MTSSSTTGPWQTVTDRLARIRETLADVARELSQAEEGSVGNPLFLSLLDGAAECLGGAYRTLGGAEKESGVGSGAPGVSEATLRGRTGAIAIGEILGFLSNMQKSGTVVVRTEAEEFSLRLERGNLVYATGDNNPIVLRLGEILVRQGALSEAALRRFLHNKHDGRGFLGAALVKQGLVTEAQLRQALAFQVQQIFFRLHAAPRADFEFRDSEIMDGRGDLQLNVTGLLLEAARVEDEGISDGDEPPAD